MRTAEKSKAIQIRQTIRSSDKQAIREIVISSSFFNAQEIDVAVELIEERFEKGEASGYYFLFADLPNRTVAYSCYGPIPGTASSFDLYWIAVHNDTRGQGIGKLLLQATEQAIKKMGGRRIYVETSSRAQYIPTRNFYQACHYNMEALLQDFYAPGDSKCIFVKVI
ncbi:N-acetyltransferase [candidate division KSB1 bacterium]|nr:GNAT family N-acetyltransferase [candidate division KSB1 bacterium]RQW01969.1 MAG: N-acetyltransferase [candidate division KSB1 bacterium]